MNLRKIMAATSILALTATSAHALTVSTPGAVIIPASELTLPGTPNFAGATSINLAVDTGSYPAGNNITIVYTLPSGVKFDQAYSAGDLTENAGGTAVPAVVQAGGAIGDDEVTLLVSIPNGSNIAQLNLAVDYRVVACVPAGSLLNVTANIDGSGTPIESGSASTSSIIAPCQSALDGVVVNDSGSDNTKIELATNYTSLTPVPGSLTATLGTVQYTIDPAVSVTGAPAAMTANSIDEITFDVVLGNAAGFTNITVGGVVPDTFVGGVASFTFAAADLGALLAGPLPVIVTVDGTTTLATQTVNLTNANVNFNDTEADLITNEAGATGGLDTLEREGQTYGVFDWNSGAASGTVSVYRVTGLTAPTTYSVIMTNAGPANGTYTGTATPDAAGEYVMNSLSYGVTGLPAYVRGDVEFIFETLNPVDVDRLMARGGIVTAFGDGSNTDVVLGAGPDADSDN